MQQPETNDRKPANDKLIKNYSRRNQITQLRKVYRPTQDLFVLSIH